MSQSLRWLKGAILAMLAGMSAVSHSQGAEPLVVGLTGKYPPFNYFDPSGKLVGFDVDIAEALCKDLERKCEYKILQWDGILSALLAERVDVIIASMAITEARSKQVRFTSPYYESGAQLFIRSEAPESHAPGFRIGVTLGTTYGEFARKNFPDAVIRTYKGDVEALQDIKSGRLDAMVTDRMVGLYMNQQYSAGLELRGEPLYLEKLAIPVHPQQERLWTDLDAAVKRLRASPLYESLFEKYFGKASHSPPDAFGWNRSLSLLLHAAVKTLLISASGISLGLIAALLLVALVLLSPPPLGRLVGLYIDFIRATPFMIQLFTLYFGLPALGLKLSAWNSGVLAIAIHSSAYLSEIIKASYQSVPAGQHFAGKTLGLTRAETLLHVIFPQMLPVLTTPTLNTVVAMIKDSAIVSVVSVHELTMQAQQLISATFRPMEFYLLTALLYFLMTYPLLLLGRGLEGRFKRKGLLHA